MGLIEHVSPPWRLIAFLVYMGSLIAGAIALRTWLIAGALVGLFFFVFTWSAPLSRDDIPKVVIAVVGGAIGGWVMELANKSRKPPLE
jgi:hypothetical protein